MVDRAASPRRAVIVGCGFGGLFCARALKTAPLEAVVVDRNNYHLFQPLLYQVATAALSPADIAQPIRTILRDQRNSLVVLGEVDRVALAENRIYVNGEEVLLSWIYSYVFVRRGSRLITRSGPASDTAPGGQRQSAAHPP